MIILEEKDNEGVDFLGESLVLEFAVCEVEDKRYEIPKGKRNKKLGGGNGLEKSKKDGKDHYDG